MTKEDLKKFCLGNPAKPWISNPWSIGKNSLATNGYFLIRIPRLKNIPENLKAPDCSSLWPDQPQEWFEIPKLPGIGKEKIFDQKISIGGVDFGVWLLRILKDLPNIKIGPMGEEEPAWIKFDGGDGLIMPMRKEKRMDKQ